MLDSPGEPGKPEQLEEPAALVALDQEGQQVKQDQPAQLDAQDLLVAQDQPVKPGQQDQLVTKALLALLE